MHCEWDEAKARSNQRKHGVSFDEALSVFFDPIQIALYDPDHSDDETRELLIGHDEQGRLLLVSYTVRDETIRIISARKANTGEAKYYASEL